MLGARAFTIVCLAILAISSAGCRAERPAKAPDQVVTGRPIVLVTVDTLRADRLGSYGSARGLTPALDRFAQSAARFTAAVTQVPITLPAHATILTGLHPARHGVRTNDGFRLAADVPTVADAIRGRGYTTGAFIGGYPLQASSGLSPGFDRYEDDFLRKAGAVEHPADAVGDAALGRFDTFPYRLFCIMLHLFDPHSPYTPPPPFGAAHADAPYRSEE